MLLESHGHRTAGELAADAQLRAPDVNLSTIYRNLDELERLVASVGASRRDAHARVRDAPAPRLAGRARCAVGGPGAGWDFLFLR